MWKISNKLQTLLPFQIFQCFPEFFSLERENKKYSSNCLNETRKLHSVNNIKKFFLITVNETHSDSRGTSLTVLWKLKKFIEAKTCRRLISHYSFTDTKQPDIFHFETKNNSYLTSFISTMPPTFENILSIQLLSRKALRRKVSERNLILLFINDPNKKFHKIPVMSSFFVHPFFHKVCTIFFVETYFEITKNSTYQLTVYFQWKNGGGQFVLHLTMI